MRPLAPTLALAALLAAYTADAGMRGRCRAPGVGNAYDLEIRAAARRYLPRPYKRHFCLLKSQYYVESRLDPGAVSPAGAQGIAQIMPGTLREIERRDRIKGSAFHARTSIRAGAAYLARQIAVWSAPRSAECRIELAWASYNAGAGNIIAAQRQSGGKRCWDGIGPALHKVTGRHSAETLGYVSRIWAAWRRLRGLTVE